MGILMVATVELPNEISIPKSFSPKEVLRRIVDKFVGKMFYCRCCSYPYLEAAYAIGFQNFDDADGIRANYWLWRMHNNLTARLALPCVNVHSRVGRVKK